MRAHGQLVDHQARGGGEHLHGQQPGHAQFLGDVQGDPLGHRGLLGIEAGGGGEDLDADAVTLDGLHHRVADALAVRRPGDQHGEFPLERHEPLGHQRHPGGQGFGRIARGAADPDAAPVVPTPDRLEHDRPAVLRGELLDVGGRPDPPPGRARGADLGQPLAHHRLVLGVYERVGAGVHGEAVLDQGTDVLGGHVLVIEGDRVAPLGEVTQVRQGPVVAQAHVGDHAGGALVRGVGQDPKLDAEGDGRLLGHPGQLARSDHADDGSDGTGQGRAAHGVEFTVTRYGDGRRMTGGGTGSGW